MTTTKPKPIASLFLPIQLTNDNGGRNAKWYRTAKRKAEYAMMVRVYSGRRVPFDFPVVLRITRILGPRQQFWDEDSIGRGSAKELVDAIVQHGWLHDDKRKWVSRVIYQQTDKHRDRGPAVQVDFLRAD